MKIVAMTLWLYTTALKRSFECVRHNWLVSFAPLAYGLILSVAGMLVWPLGIIGGLLMGLAYQACISSGLYLIGNMINQRKAVFNDFIRGFGVYLWELLGIAFILWIPLRLASTVLAGVPNGGLIYLMIQIALYVFLNPLPELIYQSRVSGLELLSASYNFIVENWIEWFIPNLVLTIAGYFLLRFLAIAVFGLPGFIQSFIQVFAFGLCVTYFMVFRGFLFSELYGTTRRSREYKYRTHG